MGRGCSQTALSASNHFLTVKGHQEQSAQEAGTRTTGLLEDLELKGQVLWQEMLGGIPGLLSAHLSCPRLAPAHPGLQPGIRAWLLPLLPRSAQLSWPQQRQPHVCWWRQLRRHLQRSLIYLLRSPRPSSSCTHPCHEVPAPLSPPAPTIVRTITVIITKGHTARPACGTQSSWFPTFYQ